MDEKAHHLIVDDCNVELFERLFRPLVHAKVWGTHERVADLVYMLRRGGFATRVLPLIVREPPRVILTLLEKIWPWHTDVLSSLERHEFRQHNLLASFFCHDEYCGYLLLDCPHRGLVPHYSYEELRWAHVCAVDEMKKQEAEQSMA